MFVFSHIFPLLREVTFQMLEIVWINASNEICKKRIVLECLCFPMRFSNENSLSHVFGMAWTSVSREIRQKAIS